MENAHQRQRLLEAEVKIQVAQKILQEAALDLNAGAKSQRKGWYVQIKEQLQRGRWGRDCAEAAGVQGRREGCFCR